MNKRGFEWLNLGIIVMSVVIVVFAAVALTVISDVYHPDQGSVLENKKFEIPGIKTGSSAGTGSGTSVNTNKGISGTSGGSGGSETTTAIRTTTPSCTNECSSYGSRKCAGSSVEYCGDFDGNGCLEWGNSFICTTGCLNGNCKSGSIVSDIGCTESNPTHNLSVRGNVIDKTGIFNSDVCYNSTTLKQYYCRSDNSSSYSFIGCQNGCSAGICLSGTALVQPNVPASPNCATGERLVTSCAYSSGQDTICSGNLVASSNVQSSSLCQQFCGNASAGCYRNTGSYSPNCECYSGSVANNHDSGFHWSGGNCAGGQCVNDNSIINCDAYLAQLNTLGAPLNYCSSDSDCRVQTNFNSNCYQLLYNVNADLSSYNNLVVNAPSSCLSLYSGCSASMPIYGLTMYCINNQYCRLDPNQCLTDSDCGWYCPDTSDSAPHCGSDKMCGCYTSRV